MDIINSDLDNINKIFSPAKNADGNIFLNQTGAPVFTGVINTGPLSGPASAAPPGTPPATNPAPGTSVYQYTGPPPASTNASPLLSSPTPTISSPIPAGTDTNSLFVNNDPEHLSTIDGVYVSTPAPVVTTPPANNNNVILIGGVALGAIGLIVGLVMHFKDKVAIPG